MVSFGVAEETRLEGRLGDLYVRHAPAAGRFAYLLTTDRGEAEDLVQEAFVRVVGRFGHLRVPDAFHAYLRRTIVNLRTSKLRRKRLERAYLDRERNRRDPQAPFPDVALREGLWRAVQRLPVRQRAHWEAEGTPFLAYLGLGPEAALPDRDVLIDAFESLRFEPFELHAPASTTPGYVLESLGSGDLQLNLELRRKRDGYVWLELASPLRPEEVQSGFTVSTVLDEPGIDCLVTPIGPATSDGTASQLGAIIFGMVPDRVARIEIETDEGQIVTARLLRFPRSIEGSFSAFVAASHRGGGDHGL